MQDVCLDTCLFLAMQGEHEMLVPNIWTACCRFVCCGSRDRVLDVSQALRTLIMSLIRLRLSICISHFWIGKRKLSGLRSSSRHGKRIIAFLQGSFAGDGLQLGRSSSTTRTLNSKDNT